MNKARVLIVEDEGIVASDLHYMVEEMGYIVAGVVRDGHAAIHSAETLLPDVVLMDITLPGASTVSRLRKVSAPISGFPLSSLQRTATKRRFGALREPPRMASSSSRSAAFNSTLTLFWALRIRDLEHELRESNKWLSEILDDLDEAVIAADLQGKIRYLNQVASQVTEWSSAETIGKDLTDVVHIISSQTNQSLIG